MINDGVFLNNLLSFFIVAALLFVLVRSYNELQERYRARPGPPAPTAKTFPHCRMKVPVEATRCGHCTSETGD